MAKILVVDDDPHILLLLRTTFEGAGHQVLVSSDPHDVPRLVLDPDLDAVILDIMLPRTSGWELLAAIRDDPQTEQLPVIMLSSLSAVNDRVRGIRTGADDYLVKPFHPDELLARVEALISKSLTAMSTSGLHGRLGSYPINELMQSFEQNKKSGTLEVFSGGVTGRVQIIDGAPSRAEVAGLRGTDAILEMLEMRDGTFRFTSGPIQGSANAETRSFQSLMIDAAWLADELQKRVAHQPGGSIPLEVSSPLPDPLPDAWQRLPVRAVAARVREVPGLTTDELLKQRLAAAGKVRLAVACLCESGVLCETTAADVDHQQLEQLRMVGSKTGVDVIGKLLGLFRDETTANVMRLRAAAVAGDGEEIVRVAHQMKGTSSAVCAPRLSGLCAALEEGARERGAAALSEEILNTLEEAVQRTLQGLETMQSRGGGSIQLS